MKFTKMHGIGNDYVYVNCFKEYIPDRCAMAVRVSNRNFGIGSDGLICICPSDRADFLMDMYNPDGSRSEMCGNGIRCVGKYVYDNGLTDKTEITVESGGMIKILKLFTKDGKVESVQVNMGKPVLNPADIPVLAQGDTFIDKPVDVDGGLYNVTCVSMGNPHAVVFVPDVDELELPRIGPAFENHSLFPNRVNAEFVQVVDENTLKMRVWERGTGETLACGTGASASFVAANLNGKCGDTATLKLRGGDLHFEWNRDDNCVYMTGSATTVFDGELYD